MRPVRTSIPNGWNNWVESNLPPGNASQRLQKEDLGLEKDRPPIIEFETAATHSQRAGRMESQDDVGEKKIDVITQASPNSQEDADTRTANDTLNNHENSFFNGKLGESAILNTATQSTKFVKFLQLL
jgi:hypothetical protein